MSTEWNNERRALLDWAVYLFDNPGIIFTVGLGWGREPVVISVDGAGRWWSDYGTTFASLMPMPFVSMAVQYWAASRLKNQYGEFIVLRENTYFSTVGGMPLDEDREIMAAGGAVIRLGMDKDGSLGGQVHGLTLSAALLEAVKFADATRESKLLAEHE